MTAARLRRRHMAINQPGQPAPNQLQLATAPVIGPLRHGADGRAGANTKRDGTYRPNRSSGDETGPTVLTGSQHETRRILPSPRGHQETSRSLRAPTAGRPSGRSPAPRVERSPIIRGWPGAGLSRCSQIGRHPAGGRAGRAPEAGLIRPRRRTPTAAQQR